MKKTALLISFLFYLIILGSCKKDNSISLNSKLVGRWELRILYGGQVANSSPFFPPGNGDIWEFTGALYKRYANGQLTANGTYSLIKANPLSAGIPDDALMLDHDITRKIHLGIVKDSLTLYDGIIAADGYIATYVRQ